MFNKKLATQEATTELSPANPVQQRHIVIPGTLTGSSPIFLDRAVILEVTRTATQVTLLTTTNQTTRLNIPKGSNSAAVLDQMLDLAFQNVRPAVEKIFEATGRYLNPAQIERLNLNSGVLHITLRTGALLQIYRAGIETLTSITETLFGSEAADEAREHYVSSQRRVVDDVRPPKLLTFEEQEEMRQKTEAAKELAIERGVEKARKVLRQRDEVFAAIPSNYGMFLDDVTDKLAMLWKGLAGHQHANYNAGIRAVILNIRYEIETAGRICSSRPALPPMTHDQYSAVTASFSIIRTLLHQLPTVFERVRCVMLAQADRIALLPEVPRDVAA